VVRSLEEDVMRVECGIHAPQAVLHTLAQAIAEADASKRTNTFCAMAVDVRPSDASPSELCIVCQNRNDGMRT
jgi:hypothetical protein